MKSQNHEIGDLKMRKAVGIILIRKDGFVWTGKRKLGPGVRSGERNLWQMPQGGIDDGEKPIEAAFRELEEETGSKSAKLLFESEDWLEYKLPDELIGKVLKGFKGQKQKWMALRFTGRDEDININTAEPEFCEWRWLEPRELVNLAVPFKRDVYDDVLKAFSSFV